MYFKPLLQFLKKYFKIAIVGVFVVTLPDYNGNCETYYHGLVGSMLRVLSRFTLFMNSDVWEHMH